MGSGGLVFSGGDAERTQRGFDMTLGVEFEQTGFASGSLASQGSGVLGYGEWGLGTFAEVGRTQMHELEFYSFVIGVHGRLPAMLGVLCCASPR